MEKILVINPGSTSTKIAVYEDEQQLVMKSISHSTEDLSHFPTVFSQYEFRKEIVTRTLRELNVNIHQLTAVVARGGVLAGLKAGAYLVNRDMLWQLEHNPIQEHASNLGAPIAYAIAHPSGIPAYIYDAVSVDEMPKLTKLTGWKEIEQNGFGHNLNTRAVAIKYAKEHNREYKDITVIVAHLGGGITINLHHHGTIIDVMNDDVGGFTPERSGALPMSQFVSYIYKEHMEPAAIKHKMKTQGGLVAHLGTNNTRLVEERILQGDEYAELVYEAMAMNVAKNIAREFPVVNGDVEAILLTGGIANSKMFTDMIKDRLAFLCDIFIYPGENEMDALALGALRVQRKEEKTNIINSNY